MKKKTLPLREEFRDSLQQRDLSLEEYQHAQQIWEITTCHTLGDYVKLYCEIDVGLLADVYMKYKTFLQELYGLDVIHYVSLSAFAYDAFLKSTGVRLRRFVHLNIREFTWRVLYGLKILSESRL